MFTIRQFEIYLLLDEGHSLDSLVDIPRLAAIKRLKQKRLDDESGYDHVFMSDRSLPLMGIQWQNWYLV